MSGTEIQEVMALAVVALVVAIAVWRRARHKAKGAPGCSNCDTPAARKRESTLHFHRRRP
jgi:hypothetical protein